ncbi:MAG: (2Fe-2S)-binding protein [Leptospirales bacterium]|nr:(2Fe-2S)-binding protein [Leptospirales bacterium]
MSDPSMTDIYALMRPRKVCVCRSVTENMILDSLERGARSFEDVQNETGCSTGCGTCESAVRAIIEKKLSPT